MDSPAVLDASALLAVIFQEPGCAVVEPLLPGALVSTVNLAEAHARLLLAGSPPDLAWSRLLSLGYEICPFEEEQARLAAELLPISRSQGLSLGDRACLALALERKATVYTTNHRWKNLALDLNTDLEIEVIR